LNVYVCNDIGGAAGYTFNPNGGSTANASNMYYNGIFMLHDYTGSIGTSNTTNSRALTHEVGHWLNLSHVWGANNNPGSAGCSGTDNVNDTPATQGSTSCTLTANTCTSVDTYYGFDQIDNVQNYMDYSYCSKMFTQGQVDRMRAAIISSTGGRSNIWTTANLNLVGGVPGGSLCALDFTATDVAVCAGDQTTFTMSAGGAPITSYSWTFTGGTPSSSTAASPTVTYSTPGTYQVSLTIVSGGQSYTKTKSAYISVAGGTLVSLPITEGFTAGTIPFTNWTLTNAAPTNLTWVRNTSVGYNSTNSARLDNYSGANAGDDEMGLPNFSATTLSSITMEFDVAYRPYDATYYDGLQVLASGDCGATYTTVYDKSNLVLATVGSATTSGFVPSGNSQWRHETIDLSSFAGSSRVILRMKAISGNGNYMYIDNVNITGVTSSTPPTANFTPSVTTVCAGQSVTFTNSSTGAGNSYSWSFPGGTPSSSTATSPTITYSTPGTYSVSLQATNGNGTNTATQNNSITVNAIPSAPTITPGGPTTFCQGGNVVLTSSAASGNTWSNNSTGTTLTASTSGNYTVSGCVSPASSAVTVTVNPNPTVSFGSVSQLCVYDAPITLTQGSPAGGTYSGTGVSGNQFDPAVAGLGNEVLTYSYTNGNGCSGSAQTTVVISDCLGVDEAGNITLSIYPNPSEGFFTIVANETVVSTMVYDQSGKLVKEIKGESVNEVAVDLTSFAGGVYTVKVITESSVKSVPVMLMK
jgi:PKD repeat protein